MLSLNWGTLPIRGIGLLRFAEETNAPHHVDSETRRIVERSRKGNALDLEAPLTFAAR
jgi:hypothetical protein